MTTTDPNEPTNPYAPPADLAPTDLGLATGILADRGTRLGARLLDGMLLLGVILPGLGLLFALGGMGEHASDGSVLSVLVMGVGGLGLCGYQWYLLATTGQTLGKKWLQIKVVRLDGSPVDFVSAVLLRNWVIALLTMIPAVGSLVGLVDSLMIFGEQRRCLHDLIAGTKVVPRSLG